MAKKSKYSGVVTLSRLERIFARENGKCFWCGIDVIKGDDLKAQGIANSKRVATKDHVLPRSRGGTHDIDNLVLSCTKCNWKKSNMLFNPVTWEPISPSVLSVFLKGVC